MTREEAINIVQGARQYLTAGNPIWDTEKVDEAMKMAIEALQAVLNCQKCAIKELWKETEKEDLVAAVRCKNCDRGFGSPVCPIQSQGWAINKDTFYCAWGERREP